ncbi:shikimate dehydrogenase [Weissella tructae]|uniref:Shikimate dehydrogenase (NADP(+)) n=2 Tax=Weissella TaxID=46255 RepID=A0A075TZQ7_9LACO|nr:MULTISPECIES: shikimate dehydrogenase [Weissella]AIG65771.1 Shikimate dehydrogenase (NADP(+)) [Weissella tructae]AIM63150.1 Shikimate dehydrogenase (NADP(+)) [Weissella ceti]AIM64486.1 Shikimate dehydrogenase (NADP(+)) [Weissella ceti]ELA06776.1 shikimate dehydrogenase [Weissella ceti NC36]QVV90933.1 shikimate dehydrogenase [Weissella tructae]
MQKFGLIGWPIEHSLSPNIHNAGFSAEGTNAEYTLVPIQPENFEHEIMDVLQTYQGLNVTTPYKQRVMSYLDVISDVAQKTGAVNTIYRGEDGLLYGDTTDGFGFWQSSHIKAGQNVVMIGCGGAARAIMATVPESVKLFILNRKSPRYEGYQEVVADLLGSDVHDIETFSDWAAVDVLIDATSVGLGSEETVLNQEQLALLPAKARVIDLKYRGQQLTPLLQKAQQIGLETMDGQAMLLEQAILSHQQWIQSEPHRESMMQALR